jgi:hypothetical protein
MKKLKEEAIAKESNKRPELTQAFKAISREKYETTTRNRTEPPNLGYYNPKWSVVKPRTDAAPKYSQETTARDHLSTCLDCSDMPSSNSITDQTLCSHIYPKGGTREFSPRKDVSEDNSVNRTSIENRLRRDTYNDFSGKANIQQLSSGTPRLKLKSALDFSIQTKREEFVKESDPPHAERFSFMEPHSLALSTNRKSVQFDFSKVRGRSEAPPVNWSTATYNPNKEAVQPKTGKHVLMFSKRPERLANINLHSLSTPRAAEWSTLEKSLKLTMKSPQNIPVMKTTTPRDDLMYRTTERYSSNVPEKQLASDPPQHGGYLRRTMDGS